MSAPARHRVDHGWALIHSCELDCCIAGEKLHALCIRCDLLGTKCVTFSLLPVQLNLGLLVLSRESFSLCFGQLLLHYFHQLRKAPAVEVIACVNNTQASTHIPCETRGKDLRFATGQPKLTRYSSELRRGRHRPCSSEDASSLGETKWKLQREVLALRARSPACTDM